MIMKILLRCMHIYVVFVASIVQLRQNVRAMLPRRFSEQIHVSYTGVIGGVERLVVSARPEEATLVASFASGDRLPSYDFWSDDSLQRYVSPTE